jgi:exodeoxyribonuclease VIII
MKSEIILDMPSEVYHALPRLSNSKMSDFLRSPRYLQAVGKRPRKSTNPMSAGTMLHCALLEPAKFAARYLPVDLDRKGTKEWKALEQANPGKELVKTHEYEEIIECTKYVRENDAVRKLFSQGVPQTEVTITWTAELGIAAKARLDLISPGSHLVDLKLTHEVDKFERTAFSYGYHRQAAWYLRAAIAADVADENTPFYFVCVESDFPYEMRIYQASDDFISAGNREIEGILADYAQCLQTNEWPDRVGPWQLDLPKWARGEYE